MDKRPVSVTILSLLMLASGTVGLVYHFREFKPQHPFQDDAFWVLVLRVLAIVCGVFMLRGSNWARWLTLLWIAFHLVLSFFHSAQEVIAHGALLAVYAFFLLRPAASGYFRRSQMEAA